MLELLFSNPLFFLIYLIALLVAVTIHEFAHAWAADRLGDPTPRINDRLTLNPISHIDPLGAIALLIANVGWGKPVPIDPYNLKSPKRDSALISLSGPASNLILATLFSLILRIPLFTPYSLLFTVFIQLNVGLAIFNLLPIPPLDGSKILLGFLPLDIANEIEGFFRSYGPILLLILIFPIFGGSPLIVRIIYPIINTILRFLLPV
jgi:Zn-dependent protease